MKTQPRFIKKILLAGTLLAACTSASAGAVDDIGFYFGAGISQTSLDTNQKNMAVTYATDPQSRFETDGLGLNLMVGIELDQHLAFELSYTEIGSVALDDGTTLIKMFDADILNVTAVLSHPISQNVDVFGKLGVSYWSTLNEDVDVIDSGNGLIYGAGFDVNVYGNNNRVMRLEWQHQEFDNVTFESADTVSVSAVFKF